MTLSHESRNALETIRAKAAPGGRIVFVSGIFNVLHPGHQRLLRFASECGDFLVVGVFEVKTHDSVFLPEEKRLQAIRSIGWVNHSFILRDTPENFIAALRPCTVVKGKEYESLNNREAPILAGYGGKLLFSSGDTTFSSIDALSQDFREINFSSIVKPRDFPERHGFSIQDLYAIVDRMRRLRVCVIGDLVVDEYIACDPLGMSQEDPTIVVAPHLKETFIGGAGIVAAHARELASDVAFISVSGQDEAGEFASRRLEQYHVSTHLFTDESRPTTRKRRYRAAGKTLLRVNHFRQHQLSDEYQKRIFDRVALLLASTDLVVFSDFNYGILAQRLVDSIVAACQTRGIPMVADSQSSSQVGDVSRFKGMSLITPTEREARLATRNFQDGIVVMAEQLRRLADAQNVFVTLGTEGLLIHAAGDAHNKWLTDRLPAFNTAPRDPAGAGDILMVYSSMAMAAGCSVWEAAYLGSLAAACQVGRVGNIPLTVDEIRTEIDK